MCDLTDYIFSKKKMIKLLSRIYASILKTGAVLSYLEHRDQVFVEIRDNIRTGHCHGVREGYRLE